MKRAALVTAGERAARRCLSFCPNDPWFLARGQGDAGVPDGEPVPLTAGDGEDEAGVAPANAEGT
jgi:hypothetical protein